MFCKYCGKEIPDNTIFCPNCGRQIGNPGQPANNTGQTAGGGGQSYGAGTGRPAVPSAPRGNIVNDFCKSTLFLVFNIIVTAQFMFNSAGVRYSFFDFLTWAAIGFMCVCCWIIYIISLLNNGSKAGFSLLRIGIPVYLVVRVIVTIASMVTTARWTYGGVKALYIIVELVTLVLCVVCYVGLFLTADDAYQILDGRDSQWRVRSFTLVIFIVLAAVVVFGDIFITAIFGYWFTAFSIIGVIAEIAVYVLAVVILFVIRKKNKEICG